MQIKATEIHVVQTINFHPGLAAGKYQHMGDKI